eukprot:gene12699-10885_t
MQATNNQYGCDSSNSADWKVPHSARPPACAGPLTPSPACGGAPPV